jgi:hypothetical protein
MVKKVLFVCLAIALMIAPTVMLSDPATAQTVVDIDIKPGSFPNSINVKERAAPPKAVPPKAVPPKGVLPVAILGSEDFNVTTVNASTVVLTWRGITPPDGNVSPLRWAYEDVNRDGFMDIGLKYSIEELGTMTGTKEPPGDLIMMLMGNLKEEHSGTPIVGYDTVRIINKGYVAP